MPTSYGALANDFYINQKLAMKMDLPEDRETILHFFDRLRRADPALEKFRRYDGEYALETARSDAEYRWISLRHNSIRTGHVNPQSMEEATLIHRMILEQAPYHLTISPLDVDYLELMYGFDLECDEDHDQVVYDALFADTPLGGLVRPEEEKVLDLQPVIGSQLSESGDLQAYFEVKTRQKSRRGSSRRYAEEPISLFLTLRKYGPVQRVEDLQPLFHELVERCETLASERLVPELLTPIAQAIASSNAG